MSDCKYYIGKNEYTEQEFKEYLAEGGLDAFIEEGALKLSDVFNAPKQPKSETPKVESQDEKTKNGNTRDENDFIHEILSKEINEVEYPIISADINGTAKQDTAKTQGEVQDRSVDGNYVKLTLENLKAIALETSKKLEEKYGNKWVEKTLNFLETRNVSNAQMIGVLNTMSTKVLEDIKEEGISDTKYNNLKSLQKRIDNVTNKISRIASLSLNMRRVLRKFAQGENINSVLAQTILTKEVRDEIQSIEQSLERKKTDNEINNASRPTNPKTKTTTTKKSSQVAETTRDELLQDIRQKANEYRQKSGNKDLKSKMKDIAERIKKNCK